MAGTTLLLNASYEPLTVISTRRAFSLLQRGRALPVGQAAYDIPTATDAVSLPKVLVLRRYINVPKRGARFSRAGVFRRDNHTCAYCNTKFPARKLTLDHVIPASRGGKLSWGNVVTACAPCNQRKANRTPGEAGMKLGIEPKTPRVDYLVLRGEVPAEWKMYVEV